VLIRSSLACSCLRLIMAKVGSGIVRGRCVTLLNHLNMLRTPNYHLPKLHNSV
jgi:hypothetical protein